LCNSCEEKDFKKFVEKEAHRIFAAPIKFSLKQFENHFKRAKIVRKKFW